MRRGVGRATIFLFVVSMISAPNLSATAANFFDYAIVGIPDTPLTGPTPFTVEVTGSEPVCSMTFQDTKLTKAPWSFIYQLDGGNRVLVSLCNGEKVDLFTYAVLPWSIWSGRFGTIEYGSNVRQLAIKSDVDESATVLVSFKGKQVGQGEIQAQQTANISFKAISKDQVATYRVEITGATSGTKVAYTAVMTNMWQSMNDGEPTYPRCSTVYWNYDSRNAPRNASINNMKSDISGALARLSKETGLTFVEAQSPLDSDASTLTFNWNLGRGHGSAAATGGYEISAGVKGTVRISKSNWWPSNDAYRGFGLVGKPRTISGRGWLFVHEVMHTMGLYHTTARSEIMYATMSRQTKLGQGDLAALHYLYKPEACRGG